jgi:hypothetical protein
VLPALSPPRLQNISDEDVLALVSDEVHQPSVVWVLEDLQVGAHFLHSFVAAVTGFARIRAKEKIKKE